MCNSKQFIISYLNNKISMFQKFVKALQKDTHMRLTHFLIDFFKLFSVVLSCFIVFQNFSRVFTVEGSLRGLK